MGRDQKDTGSTRQDDGQHDNNGTPSDSKNGAAEGTRQDGAAEGARLQIVGASEEKLHGLAAVIPEAKRKPGRPPGSGTKQKGTGLSVSDKPAGKKHDLEQSKMMVATLLNVVFNIASSREGLEHWRLSPNEIEALSEPIAAIMDRHDLTKVTGSYGEYIALIAAVGMIIVPRVMFQHQQAKQKRGVKTNVQNISDRRPNSPGDGGTNPAARSGAASSGGVQGPDSDAPEPNLKSALVSVIG